MSDRVRRGKTTPHKKDPGEGLPGSLFAGWGLCQRTREDTLSSRPDNAGARTFVPSSVSRICMGSVEHRALPPCVVLMRSAKEVR